MSTTRRHFGRTKSYWLRRPSEVWAHLELPDAAVDAGDAGRYAIHPVLLDAGLRLSEAVFPTSNDDEIYLPYAFGDLTYFSSAGNELWVKATGVESNKTRVVDLELYNAGGELVATVERFTLRSMPQSKLRQAVTPAISSNDALGQWIYDQKLEEVPGTVDDEATPRRGKWLVFVDQTGVARSSWMLLKSKGVRVWKSKPAQRSRQRTRVVSLLIRLNLSILSRFWPRRTALAGQALPTFGVWMPMTLLTRAYTRAHFTSFKRQ